MPFPGPTARRGALGAVPALATLAGVVVATSCVPGPPDHVHQLEHELRAVGTLHDHAIATAGLAGLLVEAEGAYQRAPDAPEVLETLVKGWLIAAAVVALDATEDATQRGDVLAADLGRERVRAAAERARYYATLLVEGNGAAEQQRWLTVATALAAHHDGASPGRSGLTPAPTDSPLLADLLALLGAPAGPSRQGPAAGPAPSLPALVARADSACARGDQAAADAALERTFTAPIEDPERRLLALTARRMARRRLVPGPLRQRCGLRAER